MANLVPLRMRPMRLLMCVVLAMFLLEGAIADRSRVVRAEFSAPAGRCVQHRDKPWEHEGCGWEGVALRLQSEEGERPCSPVRLFIGAGEESRTPDLRITNALLYQLSYTGFVWGIKLLQTSGRF